MSRAFNPLLLERLNDEAFALQTSVMAAFDRGLHDVSNHAATWQPGPCPDDWVPSDVAVTEPDPTTKRWRIRSTPNQGET